MAALDYDIVADRFGTVVRSVRDWDAPTPVPEWRARDVVGHLTTWLPELLESCGVELPMGIVDDPVRSWIAQDDAVRALLVARGDEIVTHGFLGTRSISDLLAEVYVGDVFLHTWDLARAAGIDDGLDPEVCRTMLVGMEAMEDVIRDSGHFGRRWPDDPGDDPIRRLVAFIGRDPDWHPPA